ncbi:histidine phosphatase family protein [Actinomycetospora sp. TBRC 11914]|uniref:histidine phosphatase family protein n=1 Tax=Actinomycetospora sp. TBRC 11914 TaxID=2729387 RepID=UPI00145DB729|nr:histidine phosphatase family protein [Actinomycetospora sp. TBRC 11914]NMO93557.1 histidine phosphatase family protein [Actinomycetospora sp. TBRC 11914]
MTEIVLVRHGETVWHAENRYTGRSDVPLSARGREQAAALARWAATAGLDAVVTSPSPRARDTAEAAAKAAGHVAEVDPRLVEVDFGAGDGLTREEMAARFPAERDAFLARPATQPLPGGEPGRDAVARAMPVLREVGSAHPDGRVLVVAHQTLIRLLLCELLGIPLDDYRRVFPRVGGAARTVVRPAPAGPAALLAYNVPSV